MFSTSLYLKESFTSLDTETKDLPNYTAAKPFGDSWTDKVLALKESKEEYTQGATSQGLGDGADDDEWVSFIFLF